MKFVLVLTILSVFSDLNLNIVTNKSFDTLEECLDHEIHINSVDFNFGLVCIDDWDLEEFNKDIPTIDLSKDILPK
jgi:hypothetical protein|tara:strand:- start:486 stop:713 length:228 start_codon:yes stop_codon:yes gene_type:complete